MAQQRIKDDAPIRIPVSCLADFVSSGGRSAEALILPYKYNRRGEGFARSSYYKYAVAVIRRFHGCGNDPAVVSDALAELRTKAERQR